MIIDWDAPFQLQSPYGNLDLNLASGDRYILNRAACDAGADLRVQIDNIPSGDGGITHNIYSSYYNVKFSASLWVDDVPACDGDMNRMVQNLQRVLLSIKRVDGRLLTTPGGYPQRILDNLRYTERITHAIASEGRLGSGEGRVSVLSWTVASPFPYMITAAQTTTSIGNGGTSTLTNNGTADTYPVIHVFGPTSAFTITNNTTGLKLSYSASFPGASSIGSGRAVEFDFFRNTAYEGPAGGPYTSTNYKPGIDVTNSDFFPITALPAGNSISITGASMDVLWNQAWG